MWEMSEPVFGIVMICGTAFAIVALIIVSDLFRAWLGTRATLCPRCREEINQFTNEENEHER